MEEQASFETRAVLAPRRARLSRLGLMLPVVALVVTAWAGVSGARPEQAADIPAPAAIADGSLAVEGPTTAPPVAREPRPGRVVGLDVQRLDDVQPQQLGRDDVVAVTGWYVATAITDCPRIVVIRREGSLPEVRHDFDELAFCDRYGLLYGSRPQSDGTRDASLPAVAVTLVVGVVVPDELEMIGADATEVVVVGRFVDSADGCLAPATCRHELVVDHVAWTPDL